MKRLVASSVSVMLLTVLLFAGAHAQTADHIIKVRIPFAFEVADKTFPAGAYSLLQTAPYLISLRDSRGYTLATLVTATIERADTSGPAKLDFYADGERYVLARVWRDHDSLGHQIPISKRSTYLAKHSASVQVAAEGSQP
jgi:hypothetical protein